MNKSRRSQIVAWQAIATMLYGLFIVALLPQWIGDWYILVLTVGILLIGIPFVYWDNHSRSNGT